MFATAAQGANANTAHFDDQRKERFLVEAKIVDQEVIPTGITLPLKLTLSDGTRTHSAQFQPVEMHYDQVETDQGTVRDVRDNYRYNIAAYRLDRLLGLNMVPISVERKHGGDTGAITWWVDDVAMMEEDRQRDRIEPPDRALWNDQIQQVRVFSELIYNAEPNPRNLLITKNWKVWMVDFTRAFRTYKKLMDEPGLTRIDRRFFEALRSLNEEQLMRELSPYLRKIEVKSLLARKERILNALNAAAARIP